MFSEYTRDEKEVFHEKLQNLVHYHQTKCIELVQQSHPFCASEEAPPLPHPHRSYHNGNSHNNNNRNNSSSNGASLFLWDAATDVAALRINAVATAASSAAAPSATLRERSIADLLGPSKVHRRYFFRLSLCFSSLVVEMLSLVKEGQDVLLPPLLLFGADDHEPPEEDEVERHKDPLAAEALRQQQAEQHVQHAFVKLVPHLELVWHWYRRVDGVIGYAVRQLAALYPPYSNSSSTASFSQTRLPLVWTALGRLLAMVATIEGVMDQNPLYRQGLLATFKLLSFINHHRAPRSGRQGRDASPPPPLDSTTVGSVGALFETTTEQLRAFQQLLKKLQHDVLSGGMLRYVATRRFETSAAPHISVVAGANSSDGANRVFFTEFTERLWYMLRSVEDTVGTPAQAEQAPALLPLLTLHYLYETLYRAGFPQAAEAAAERHGPLPLWRRLYALHTHFPVVWLEGEYHVGMLAWLQQHHEPARLALVSKAPVEEGRAALAARLRQCAGSAVADVQHATTQISMWLVAMQSALPLDTQAQERHFLQTKAELLRQGLQLGEQLRYTLTQLLVLHDAAAAPLSRSEVEALAQGVELLLRLRQAHHQFLSPLAGAYHVLLQSVAYGMEKHLYNTHVRLHEELAGRNRGGGAQPGDSGAELQDQYDAVGEALTLLRQPFSPDSLVTLGVVLHMALDRRPPAGSSAASSTTSASPTAHKEHMTAKACDETFAAFSLLRCLADLQSQLQRATDCGFLYWHRQLFFPLWFRRYMERPLRAMCLPQLVAATQDALPLLRTQPARAADYVGFVRDCLMKEIVEPLCTHVENDLRVHTHTIVTSADRPRRLRRRDVPLQDVSPLLRLGPFSFFDYWFEIKALVEDYLSRQFYNLNALMPNDWKVYGEMRHLAQHRYGLAVCDGHLPGSIVDQGLDVLAITENIHVFIMHYTYNMNEQVFLQRPEKTEAKHLHTLHTRHVANSIRTHGTGILHTTINYVYKCLVKKLNILSQFLYDDHVKSRLMRDAKFVRKQKEGHGTEYPFARAELFIREMAKLGVADDGNPFLVKFMQLVAEIGNALGFMRMMRSGGLRAVADAAAFLPCLSADPTTPSLASTLQPPQQKTKVPPPAPAPVADTKPGEEGDAEDVEDAEVVRCLASACTLEAAQHVDRLDHLITRKMTEGPDYFQLLQEALGRRLRAIGQQQQLTSDHLRLFYLTVPPMCMVFTEYLARQKEQLVKKRKDGIFADDGFALGCTFLLSLFGVGTLFDSLHWFQTAKGHLAERIQQVEQVARGEAPAPSTPSSRSPHTTTKYKDNTAGSSDAAYLTRTLLAGAMKEFVALEESFVSSKVFFYRYTAAEWDGAHASEDDDDDSDDEGEEEEEEEGN